MEKLNNFDAEIAEERIRSEKNYQESVEKYPTIESIVDHYRKGMISFAEVCFRFPDESDQNEVIKLAEERNQSKN